MSLQEFLAEMGAQRRTVTVYSDEPRPELAAHFSEWNVELRFDRLPAGTAEAFVTVRRAGQFLGSFDARLLSEFFEPALTHPGTDSASESDLSSFLSLLDETVFHASARRQLLAATREFEDRAWRVAAGRLDVGFQRPGALAPQVPLYERLADRGLDVHVYLDGEWNRPAISDVTIHATRTEEIGQFWFVVFDGGPDTTIEDDFPHHDQYSQACALLAEETIPDTYSGFWTYDDERVTAIQEYLTETYC